MSCATPIEMAAISLLIRDLVNDAFDDGGKLPR